jgi:hypothetical protein
MSGGASKAERLAQADAVAAQQSSQRAASDVASSCAAPEAAGRVEVVVIGDDDAPLMNVAMELCDQAGRVVRLKTDDTGRCAFEGLAEGAYRLRLHRLDGDAWEMVAGIPLPAGQEKSWGEAPWATPAAEDAPGPRVHVVEEGECVGSIAARSGFEPQALWDRNGALHAKRGDRAVLYPGDQVQIPALRPKWEEVQTGRRYYIHRIGVPYMLAIRFLDADDRPRPRVPYLLDIRAASGGVVRSRVAETDDGGFLSEPVPSDAVTGTLLLGRGPDQQVIELRLAHLDPVDELCGVQQRLENLGYSCAGEDGVLGPGTRAALRWFQEDHGLEATGEPDAPTRAELEAQHLS